MRTTRSIVPLTRHRLLIQILWLLPVASAFAQDSGAASETPRDIAPVDLTGYWVAVVTEDWRWRMIVSPRGDYASVPLNAAGRSVADSWDGDTTSCKPYGAAGVMRMPLRIRVTWEDADTLRIDTDHGMQTRLLHFDAEELGPAVATLQGASKAEWKGNPGGRYEFVNVVPELSYLEVETTRLTPGYLRRNGVPYSERTTLREFFERHEDFGDEWLTVTTIVNDPEYLTEEFITSSSFKKLPDASSWHPTPCG